MKKYAAILIAGVILAGLASLACVSTPASPVSSIHNHGYQDGMTNWKYLINGKIANETKYSYDKEGNLKEILVYNTGKPNIFSYMSYYSVVDSEGKEVKYRALTKQEYYSVSQNARIWTKEIEIVVVNNYPLIKSLKKTDGGGILYYKDEYSYDDKGRTLVATRTYKNDYTERHEYSYDENTELGVKEARYYFNEPDVYFSRDKRIDFITKVGDKIELENAPGYWYEGYYYYLDIY